jgi:membrane fusion protein (multidrug efflux system)
MAHEQARRKPISEEQGQASDERVDESRHDRSNALETGQEKQGGIRGLLENPLIRYGAIALAAVLVIGGVVWWLIARNYETTDDAFIDAHIIHLSAQITGRIAHLRY